MILGVDAMIVLVDVDANERGDVLMLYINDWIIALTKSMIEKKYNVSLIYTNVAYQTNVNLTRVK